MASVQLLELWLNPLADPSDGRPFPLVSLERDPVVTVDVRQYATGYRAVTTPGRQQVAKVTLGIITGEQQAWLEAHMGQVVCLREGTGTKFYGIYTDSTFTPYWGFDGWQGPSFTVQEVTVSEEVAS